MDNTRFVSREDLLTTHADLAEALSELADSDRDSHSDAALELVERAYDRLHPEWEMANRNRTAE
jgi:hypothetical protein